MPNQPGTTEGDRLNILLWTTVDDFYARRLSSHVRSLAHRTRRWTLLERRMLPGQQPDLVPWPEINGVLAAVRDREAGNVLLESGVPAVNVCGVLDAFPMPSVHVDDRAVGALAAEHLAEWGVERFAFVGVMDRAYSASRQQAFEEALATRQARPGTYFLRYDDLDNVGLSLKDNDNRPLESWLLRLPRATGIFCANDAVAREVGDMCAALGIEVPHDVLLLGVDDDELICQSVQPPLSSIQLPLDQIAECAIDVLERRMAGEALDNKTFRIPPVRVVPRRSTDRLSVTDPLVSEAMDYIRLHYHEGINVEAVVEAMPVCRTLLERSFREHLSTTILREIHRVRVEEAKRLLAETDQSIEKIAQATGFRTPARLNALFRQWMNCTPKTYRQRFRA